MVKLPKSGKSRRSKKASIGFPRLTITHGPIKTTKDLEDVVLRLVRAVAKRNQEAGITREDQRRYSISSGYERLIPTENELTKASQLPHDERITWARGKGKAFTDFLLDQFLPVGHIGQRGRPRRLFVRDHKIYELRGLEKTYGQIAVTMGMTRDQVKAAYKREKARMRELQSNVARLFSYMRKQLAPFNIRFRQVAK